MSEPSICLKCRHCVVLPSSGSQPDRYGCRSDDARRDARTDFVTGKTHGYGDADCYLLNLRGDCRRFEPYPTVNSIDRYRIEEL